MRYHLRTLLIVLALAPPLLAVIVPRAALPRESCRLQLKDAARMQATLLTDAVSFYRLQLGELPPDLNALVVAPQSLAYPKKWTGPYLEKLALPVDPWNNTFHYRIVDVRSAQFCVWSSGSDGITPSNDDLFAEPP